LTLISLSTFTYLSSAFSSTLNSSQASPSQPPPTPQQQHNTQCPVEERVERVWVRVEPSDTERYCETISRVSPSPQSDDWHDEEVSSMCSLPARYSSPWLIILSLGESPVLSTKRPEVSSRYSWRASSRTPLPTPNTLVRLALQHTYRTASDPIPIERKTVTSLDVVYALKRQGKTLYGFGQ
jgi:hypothetical protein